MRKLILLFFLQLLIINNLFGAKILLTIDKNVLTINDQTILHVKVSGITPDKLPKIKNVENFNLQYIGSSSNITIINGQINSEKGYNFLISPQKIGVFRIGPAVIECNGKVYLSNTIVIKVKRSKYQSGLNDLIYATVNVNKKQVKLNEQIILTLKIYRKIDVTDLKLEEPDFKSFVVFKLFQPQTYQEVINGQEFTVTEIRYALVPTITGKFRINSFIIQGMIINDNLNAFFKNPFSFNIPFTKTFKIATQPINIIVKPIKRNVYAVGDYTITLNIDKVRANVGDTINLTVKIKGRGDLQLSNSIKLKKINGLRFYYDKPQIKIIKKDDGIYSEKIEKIAIVPEKKGIYRIPSIKLLFYNPKKEKFEYIKIPGVKLIIKSGKKEKLKIVENNQMNNFTKNVEKEYNSIFTEIKLENQSINFSFLWFLPGIFILIIFYSFRFFSTNKSKFEKELKQKGAFRILKNNLKQSYSVDDINISLKRYFRNKFNINESSTYDEIKNFIESNYSQNISYKLKEVLDELEHITFSGIKMTDYNLESLKDKILRVVREIEKSKI